MSDEAGTSIGAELQVVGRAAARMHILQAMLMTTDTATTAGPTITKHENTLA